MHSGERTSRSLVRALTLLVALLLVGCSEPFPERGEILSGRVTDPGGRPIGGAEIFLLGPPDPGASTSPEWLTRELEPAAISGDQGAFSLPAPDPGDEVDLLVRAPGYADGWDPLDPVDGPLGIRLEPTFVLPGQVVDPSGLPVAGATVYLKTAIDPRPPWATPRPTVTTDDAGRFAFPDAVAGPANLAAEAAGWAPTRHIDVEIGPATSGLTLRLVPGAVVTGRVVDPDGAPLPDASIHYIPRHRFAFDDAWGVPVECDDEGRYRIEDIPTGPLTLDALHARFPLVTRNLVVESGVNRLDFQFEAGTAIRGRVLDVSGQPVADAAVLLYEDDNRISRSTTSDADGAFALDNSPPGRYRIKAWKWGYLAAETPFFDLGDEERRLELRLKADPAPGTPERSQ